MKKIKIALILMITMLLTCVITTKTKQTKAAENPSLSIVSYNISYSEYIYLTVAVGTNNVDYNNNTVKLLFGIKHKVNILLIMLITLALQKV